MTNDEGVSHCLHWAAKELHLCVTKLLMNAGAELDAALSNGCTPFTWLRKKGTRRR